MLRYPTGIQRTTCASHMRCLICWTEIGDSRAKYTRPCHHVFCHTCATTAFARELACPYCETLLPKNSIVDFLHKPDPTRLKDISSTTFGLHPRDLCHILRYSLDFWEDHRGNEEVYLETKIRDATMERDKARTEMKSVSAQLNQEKLKNRALQLQVQKLEAALVEMEQKCNKKEKAARKIELLYEHLRSIYKRLDEGVLDASAPNLARSSSHSRSSKPDGLQMSSTHKDSQKRLVAVKGPSFEPERHRVASPGRKRGFERMACLQKKSRDEAKGYGWISKRRAPAHDSACPDSLLICSEINQAPDVACKTEKRRRREYDNRSLRQSERNSMHVQLDESSQAGLFDLRLGKNNNHTTL